MAEIQKALCVTLFYERKEDWQVKIVQDEAESLLESLDFHAVYSMSFNIRAVDSATLFSSGQVEQISQSALYFNADFVYIDSALSARHQRNLEMRTGFPVLDRNELIIEIFASRASSREARLQVQLARLQFLLPRLRQSGVIYAQQRGGVRGAKGEGERKIELERRMIDTRIHQLDREIKATEDVRRTQRKSRERSGIFSFALLGYTNAGKSTILNALTGSEVLAEDKLFATLDTTTRALKLPNGQRVLLSDTVGFISNLPEGLVKAFSSTLEEALSANALIIVADASHPDAAGCLEETESTLRNLGALDKARILVINKTDAIADDISYAALKARKYIIAETSMKDRTGIDSLLSAMMKVTDEAFGDITITAACSASLISDLYHDGTVKNIEYGDGEITVTARMRKEMMAKYIGHPE